MIADWQFIRVGLFVGAIVITYWLAFRWVFDRWRGNTPRSRLDRIFQSNRTGGVLLGLAGLGIVCVAYGFLFEPRRVTVTTYKIETPKLPAGQRLRLVQIADLHVREDGPREKALPDIVRSLHPDIILHTGDFFGTRADVNSIVVKLLRSWDVPQYASAGNLDGLGDFEGCMRQAGVVVLNGAQAATCSVRGIRLSIRGFPSGTEEIMRRHLDRLPRDTFNIVLYHHPQGFPKTWDTPADLMLAGHTHGGQVRLPFYGALITLDRFDKRWESGFFEERGVRLVVSRGIGCEPAVPEMRFWCPPEVVVIDLIGCAR
jgi:predicted MPP superfamily phosphohydrolase